MKLIATALGLALIQVAFVASSADALGFRAATKSNPKPPETYVGQWYTTPDGCSYSRAQAPGYPPSWHLILNPHHIGMPGAKKSCPPYL